MVPPVSDRIPPVPPYSGFRCGWHEYAYGAFTLCRRPSQAVPLRMLLRCRGPTTPDAPRGLRFGLLPVRSPLLGESLVIFSSCGYLDVSVPRVCPHISGYRASLHGGLPHSEIPGSKVICTSPGLIAAYHVLRRRQEPGHPLCALSNLLVSTRFDFSSSRPAQDFRPPDASFFFFQSVKEL